MRLGLVIYGSPDSISGGYLYDRELVRRLTALGDEVEFVSLRDRGYAGNLAASLAGSFISGRFDVLLEDELCHPSLWLANRRLRESFPVVAIVHNLSIALQDGALRRRIEKRYLGSVDGFIFTNPEAQRTVGALAGNGLPAVLATPGADHLHPEISEEEIFDRAGGAGPLRLIFVGGFARHKGLHTIIEALERLPEGCARLSAIGPAREPAYTRWLRGKCASGALAGRVEFCGILPGEALAGRLRRSHVLVLPSSYEAYPIACLEGMGFGLPVIVTSRGGAGDMIREGKDGFLVAPGDAESLARYIEELAADRRQLAGMGVSVRRAFLLLPTWDTTARRVRAFLETLPARRAE